MIRPDVGLLVWAFLWCPCGRTTSSGASEDRQSGWDAIRQCDLKTFRSRHVHRLGCGGVVIGIRFGSIAVRA